MSVLFALSAVALMVLAGRMASVRGRSTTAWLWIAALVGPLALIALSLLGKRDENVLHTNRT